MKKKMLYLMHVPWQWIKQRPHYLAEELSHEYNVTVAYQKPYRTKGLTSNSKHEKLSFFEFFCIPFKSKSRIISILNTYFVRLEFMIFNPLKYYHIMWVTHPEAYQYVYNSNQIIYDCMDDALEFPEVKNNPLKKNQLFKLEKQLCMKSLVIFCSCSYLKNKLIERYKISSNKVTVVSNAINLKALIERELPLEIEKYFQTKTKKIIYIGTISEWFDFDLILKSLCRLNNVDYLLFGPTEVHIPKHKNIIYCGSIQHEYVFSVMKKADILVMPFKICELIKSVNPVKVYEYIYSGKPSLIVEYEETQKFKDYLFLYNDENDFINKIMQIISGELAVPVIDKDDFIKYSQWSHKAQIIIDNVNAYVGG